MSLVRRSYCRRPQDEVAKLIADPGVYICDNCVGAANGAMAGEDRPGMTLLKPGEPTEDSCTFCGKSLTVVQGLVTHEACKICDTCLDLCDQILSESGIDV